MSPKIISFPANRLDQGLDQRSVRNIGLGFISSGASVRVENGSAIMTGPGFRTSADLGTSAASPATQEGQVFKLFWAKSGTKVLYSTDPDSGTFYTTGVLLSNTTNDFGDFHEQGNGDMFHINQTDAPVRFAVAQNTTAVATNDTAITVGADWLTKFSTPTFTDTFTADNTTDTFTQTSHGMPNGTIIMVTSSGTLPSGLSGNTQYYVINTMTDTFQLSLTSGGSAVAISTDGSGTHTYSSGFVYINGTGYMYTAKSNGQLTGVPAFASGIAVNTHVIQFSRPTTFPSTYNGTFMFDLDSRLYTGGRLHFENNLYGSAPEDISNPQFFYDFQGNGAVSRVFTGKLTGGIKGIGRAYIFTNDQCFQFTGVDPVTGGTLLEPVSQNYGAYNPRCIVDMEGTVAFFGKKRLIPIEIQLAASGGSAPALGLLFDDRIKPWLSSLDDDADQADAKLHYDKTQQILKIQARRNGVLETYVHDRSANSFLPAEIRPAKSFSMFNGKSYFGHVSNGIIYHDDYGLTNDGIAIYHAWATGEIEDEKGRKYMQGYFLSYNGKMTMGCEHTVKVYIDGSTIPSYNQTFTDSLITSSVGEAIGGFSIPSSGAIGGSGDAPLVYPFRNEILLIGISGESFRVEWTVSKEGVYMKVSDFEIQAYEMKHNQRLRS